MLSVHCITMERESLHAWEEIASVCYFPWTSMSVLWMAGSLLLYGFEWCSGPGETSTPRVSGVWNGPGYPGSEITLEVDYSPDPVCLSCDWVYRH